MYTNLENFLANFSFFILFISMLIYWIQASNFETINKNNSSLNNKENSLFNLKTIGTVSTIVANGSLFFLLVFRWKESGHFPLSNLYESLMFLSWSLTVIHLFIEYSFSSGISIENLLKTQTSPMSNLISDQRKLFIGKLIGAITAPSALFTNAFATFSLPKEMQEASPLVPALQSNWLMMHVTVMILSYAALILGSLLSIGFLVITGGKNINLTSNQEQVTESPNLNTNLNDRAYGFNLSTSATTKSDVFLVSDALAIAPEMEKTAELSSYPRTSSLDLKEKNARLNLAKTLDNLSYRVLGLGFPLLTIGILSGAVWANEAWGSYWSWDPKETWALLTWLVFAIYLHTRLTKGWEGKKPALIASLGFVTVWICFLGVNLIGEGLHSYGWFDKL